MLAEFVCCFASFCVSAELVLLKTPAIYKYLTTCPITLCHMLVRTKGQGLSHPISLRNRQPGVKTRDPHSPPPQSLISSLITRSSPKLPQRKERKESPSTEVAAAERLKTWPTVLLWWNEKTDARSRPPGSLQIALTWAMCYENQ